MVHVARRMYCFQLSEPDSVPPPVALWPPNAPPISAPDVPVLTLTMPQSEPVAPTHRNTLDMSLVKMDDDRPCGTALLSATASSKVANFMTYRIGTNSSVCVMGAEGEISTIVGVTKLPGRSASTLPPTRTRPPCLAISARPSAYSLTAAGVCSGPISVPGASGSPMAIVPYALTSRATNASYSDSWISSRRNDVQRWPAVPTAPNTAARSARSVAASGMTMVALLPPSSRMVRPKRACTVRDTCSPTSDDPVKDTSEKRASLIMRSPTTRPEPMTVARMPPGRPLASSTSAMMRVVAIVTSGVVDAGFHAHTLPATIAIARFQPSTAHGKLKAVMMATSPSGFQHSSSVCPGRSDGSTCPAMVRLMPHAMSATSMNSCTSPTPSVSSLPISSDTSRPSAVRLARSATPIWRTISPRTGAGVSAHALRAACMAPSAASYSSDVAWRTVAIVRPVAGATDLITGPEPAHLP
eukprot:Partr_v1_DN17237_c0_g2_i1_m19494 putative NA